MYIYTTTIFKCTSHATFCKEKLKVIVTNADLFHPLLQSANFVLKCCSNQIYKKTATRLNGCRIITVGQLPIR